MSKILTKILHSKYLHWVSIQLNKEKLRRKVYLILNRSRNKMNFKEKWKWMREDKQRRKRVMNLQTIHHLRPRLLQKDKKKVWWMMMNKMIINLREATRIGILETSHRLNRMSLVATHCLRNNNPRIFLI